MLRSAVAFSVGTSKRPSTISPLPSKPPSTKRVASRSNCRSPKRKWSRSALSARSSSSWKPGDQLHIDADLLDLPQSLRFSGQGAANNQFLAALRARFSDYLRIDYKDLAVDAHRQMIDQRRLEMTRFLDEGCAQGGLTPAFVDYYRAEITYEWAKEIVSYPGNYEWQNGRENEALSANYYDILNQVELVEEAAIGTTHYRTFLGRNFQRHFFSPMGRKVESVQH